ncbi:DUF5518 domain-containing protein [Candidatus Methanoperedens nitratireducens]|uniref:DUF5518 domain-containing protein n=1 Tax=Candidatus Methanoperedens nitratireducens TaxID=1392998 RepID=A0A284VRR4_9EURY|nr:DUF5518 domain-containing protein [Candidatus Methanoperedens nitroreducens]SNQ61899.1 membrane hypothetical protein [Candidatus Methanoperedens nitroreducens]
MQLTQKVRLSPTQEEWKTIKFWIGTLFGAIIASTVLHPEKIRFLRINPFIYLGLCGIVSGFIAGNDAKKGAKAGFLAGMILIIFLTVKDLIFNFPSAYSYYSSITLFQFIFGIFDLILIIPVPVSIGGAIGGSIHKKIKNKRIVF